MEEFKIDPTISYDIVELPSQGIYYPNKKKTVKVAYLTASDENILSSPNLISDFKVIDELIRRKVLDKDISPDEIDEEDRRAIMIFLRNTAFGSEYEVELTDPKTNKNFTSKIDISTLKTKDFKLKENEHGEYEYFLKKSNVMITFNFLTRVQLLELEKIEKNWNGDGVPPLMTKRLEMMIKSVGGNRNMMDIHSFIVNKMPITDSQDFRKFVYENKPGLDLTYAVTTPSGDTIQTDIGFGVEFFRPFYGI